MPPLYLIKELRPYTTGAGGCSISPDGQYIAIAYPSEGKVVIYRTSDWSKVTEISEPVQFGVGFSPNGSWLAIACGSSGMKIYSVPSFSHLQTLSYGLIDMRNIPWSRDSEWLLLLCSDNYLRLISTSDWSLLSSTNEAVPEEPLSLSGKYHADIPTDKVGVIYATDDRIELQIISDSTFTGGGMYGSYTGAIGALFFPTKKQGHVALEAYGTGQYEILDWDTNNLIKTWDFGKAHVNMAIDYETESYIMIALSGETYARLITYGTWEEEQLPTGGGNVRGLALSPNNKLWVVTDDQGYIRVYSTKKPTQITLEIIPQ